MKPSTYLPNLRNNTTTAHFRNTSPDTTTIRTITPGTMTSAVLITVETTNARVTFDGSDPSAASAPSIVFPKDSIPVLVPVGAGAVIKWVSTAGTAAVVNVLELI